MPGSWCSEAIAKRRDAGQTFRMRLLILLASLLLATPTLAQYWGHYTNARYGYEVDVPPDFEGNGEATDGGGQVFYRPPAEQSLGVWGGSLETELFELVQSETVDNTAQGWAITAQSATPQWAVLAGVRGGRSFFQRFILLCDDRSYAAMRVEFRTADLNSVEPVLQGLTRSFVPTGC